MTIVACIACYLLGVVGYALCVGLVTGKGWDEDDPIVSGFHFVGAMLWPIAGVAFLVGVLLCGVMKVGTIAARKMKRRNSEENQCPS